MQKSVKPILVLALLLTVILTARSAEVEPKLNVHLFWQQGCPYCEGAKSDLRAIAARKPQVQLKSYELGTDTQTEQTFELVLSHFGYQQAAVPLVIIGEQSFLGYFEGGHSTKRYAEAVDNCLQTGCPDILEKVEGTSRAGTQPGSTDDGEAPTNLLPEHRVPTQVALFG